MPSLTAVVLGATGLVGEQLVQQLINDPSFSKVKILVRRPVNISHPKLEIAVVDFDNLVDYKNKLGQGDCIFSCIGTTSNKVKGDKKAYYRVDFDIPVNAAKIGVNAGFTSYLLVSAIGANPASKNFYLKLKGEVEKEIASISFNSFHAFRPSLLTGERKEVRVGESIGKFVMKLFSPLLLGSLKKYRHIDASQVARAMVAASTSGKNGFFIHEYGQMIKAKG